MGRREKGGKRCLRTECAAAAICGMEGPAYVLRACCMCAQHNVLDLWAPSQHLCHRSHDRPRCMRLTGWGRRGGRGRRGGNQGLRGRKSNGLAGGDGRGVSAALWYQTLPPLGWHCNSRWRIRPYCYTPGRRRRHWEPAAPHARNSQHAGFRQPFDAISASKIAATTAASALSFPVNGAQNIHVSLVQSPSRFLPPDGTGYA